MTTTSNHILIDANVCHGKPVVRGTRTPVTVILDALAAGDTYQQIKQDYKINDEDIRACIAFASSEVSQQSYVSIASSR